MAIIVTAAASGLLANPPARADAAAPTPPPLSRSFNVNGYDLRWADMMGCQQGKNVSSSGTWERNIVILDFGALTRSGGTYKVTFAAKRQTGALATTSEARQLLVTFGDAYYRCNRSNRSSLLYLGFGTNNTGSAVNVAGGQEIATQVRRANQAFAAHRVQNVYAAGADDFEDFGSGVDRNTTSRQVVDGFNSAKTGSTFFNFGAATACPQHTVPTAGSCASVLNASTIIYVSSKGLAYPLPEIYATSGANAEQWSQLNAYYHQQSGHNLFFEGAITEYRACQQLGWDECVKKGINNPGNDGWSQLYNSLSTSNYPDAARPLLSFGPTDISWEIG